MLNLVENMYGGHGVSSAILVFAVVFIVIGTNSLSVIVLLQVTQILVDLHVLHWWYGLAP